MTHLATFLPPEIELGPVQSSDYGIDIVTTDGGFEVRNARWSSPLRTFQVAFPASTRDGEVYNAVRDLYAESMGGLHSFNYRVWDDESGTTIVKVRFGSPLEIEGLATHLDKIATFSLIEVRE